MEKIAKRMEKKWGKNGGEVEGKAQKNLGGEKKFFGGKGQFEQNSQNIQKGKNGEKTKKWRKNRHFSCKIGVFSVRKIPNSTYENAPEN